MYCQKCGSQIPDNARFCSKCGTQTGVHAAPIQTASAAPRKEKKAVPAKIIGIVAVAVVTVLAVALLLPMLGGKSQALDLKQAYTVSLRGTDGNGRARLTENAEYFIEWLSERAGLDPEKADLDELLDPLSALEHYSFSDGMDVEGYTEKVFGNAMSEKELKAMWEELEPVVSAIFDLDYEITPDSGLENGDEVEISFVFNEEDMKEAGIRLQNTTWTYTVEGLTDAASVGLDVLGELAGFVEDLANEVAEYEETQEILEGLDSANDDTRADDPAELRELADLMEELEGLTDEESGTNDLDALIDNIDEQNAEFSARHDGWPATLRPYPGGKAKAVETYRTEITDTSLDEMKAWIEELKSDGFQFQDFYDFGFIEEDMLGMMNAWWATDGNIYLSVGYADGTVTIDHTNELPDLESYFN